MPYNTVVDTDSFEGLAKELYPIDEIKKLEQTETGLLNEIEFTSDLKFSARNDGSFIFAVKGAGAHGQKMINQREALPSGKPSVVTQGTAYIKEYAGVIEFTKRELSLAKNNAAAFADAKTFEMESLIINAGKYFNRQVANGVGTGSMTLVNGTQAIGQTVIEVDDATPFQIGMVLDFFNAAGTTKVESAAVVQDIDILAATPTITLVDAITTAIPDNGIVSIAGARDNASADGKELTGLPLVTDDGTLATTFQNITRTGTGEVPNYRGINLDADGATIGQAVVARLMSRAFRIAGTDFAKLKDVFWCLSPEQWRAYAAESISQIQFAPNDAMDIAGSFGNPQYVIAGKKAILDTDVDRNSAYLIRKSAVKMAEAVALDWESDLGGTSLKWLSGYPQGIMLLYALRQFFAESVREVARISDLATVPM